MGRRIWFVRHGSTAMVEAGRYCGHRDVPLSAAGREQVEWLARRWRPHAESTWCSDLRRCRETLVLLAPEAPAQIRRGWREIDFGEWEGLTWEETGCGDAEQLRRETFRFPRGESIGALRRRVKQELNEVLGGHGGDALVVAHQGSIAAAVTLLLDEPEQAVWNYRMACAGVMAVEEHSGAWRIAGTEPVGQRRAEFSDARGEWTSARRSAISGSRGAGV